MRLPIWLLIFSWILLGFKGGDPDPYRELTNILNAYKKANNLTTEIQYFSFENLESSNPTDSMLAFFHKKGDDYYFSTEGFETLQMGNKNIVVSHDEQIIQYAEVKKNSQFLLDLESFSTTAKEQGLKIEFSGKRGGKGVLNYSANEYSNTKMTMEYHRDNYFLISSDMTVDLPDDAMYGTELNKSRIRIEYFNTSTVSKPFGYELKDYVMIKGKKIFPNKKFKNYQVYQ